MDVTLLGMVMEVKPLQPEKAVFPMLVTLLGIVEFLHPAINVFDVFSIIALQLLRESKIVFPLSTIMEVKPSHLEKTFTPIDVTLLGIVTEVKLVQLENILVVDNQHLAP